MSRSTGRVAAATLAVCLALLTVAQAESGVKLSDICSGESPKLVVTKVEDAKALVDEYFADESQQCPGVFEEGFRALGELLDDSVLNDVCSSATVDRILDFHTRFIYDVSPEITNAEIKARRKLPKAERTKPLPRALRIFFILFAKQINAQCTEQFVDKIGEYSQDKQLVRDEDIDFSANVTSVEEGKKFKKVKETIMKRIFVRKFSDLQYVKLSHRMPAAVPYQPKVVKLYNLCNKRFRPILDHLLEPVVRLNSMGYKDHYVMSEETRGRLKNDESIVRWFGTFQYCEIMKNLELIALPGNEGGSSKSYAVKLGFLSEQLAAEARKVALPIDDASIEPINVKAEPVKLKSSRALTAEEIKSEVKKHKHGCKRALKDRVNPVVLMEKKMVTSMMRRLGMQPLPLGLQEVQFEIVAIVLFALILIGCGIALYFALG